MSEGACIDNGDVKTCNFDTLMGSMNRDEVNSGNFGCDWATFSRTGDDLGPISWEVLSADDEDDWTTRIYVRDLDRGDHSTRFAYGGYLQLSSRLYRPSNEVHLNQVFSSEDGPYCWSFWIKQNGQAAWIVTETNVETQKRKILLQSVKDDSFRQWHMKQITIAPVAQSKISLIIVKGSIVEIDSLKLSKGKCYEQATCNFRDGPCCFGRGHPYENYALIGRGRIANSEVHVQQLDYPHNYLYVDLSHGYRRLLSLTSEGVTEGGRYCYRFSYQIEPDQELALKISYGDYAGSSKAIATSVSADGDGWKTAVGEIRSPDPFRVGIVQWPGNATIIRVRETNLQPGACV